MPDLMPPLDYTLAPAPPGTWEHVRNAGRRRRRLRRAGAAGGTAAAALALALPAYLVLAPDRPDRPDRLAAGPVLLDRTAPAADYTVDSDNPPSGSTVQIVAEAAQAEASAAAFASRDGRECMAVRDSRAPAAAVCRESLGDLGGGRQILLAAVGATVSYPDGTPPGSDTSLGTQVTQPFVYGLVANGRATRVRFEPTDGRPAFTVTTTTAAGWTDRAFFLRPGTLNGPHTITALDSDGKVLATLDW